MTFIHPAMNWLIGALQLGGDSFKSPYLFTAIEANIIDLLVTIILETLQSILEDMGREFSSAILSLIAQNLRYFAQGWLCLFGQQADKNTVDGYTNIYACLVLIRALTLCLFILECSTWRKSTLNNWSLTCASARMIFLHAWPALDWKHSCNACIAIVLIISWSFIKAVLQCQLGVMANNMKTQNIVLILITAFDIFVPRWKEYKWIKVRIHTKHSIQHALYSHTTYLSGDYHDSIDDSDVRQMIENGVDYAIYYVEKTIFFFIPHTITLFNAAHQLNAAFHPFGNLFIAGATFSLFITYMILSAKNNERDFSRMQNDLAQIQKRIIGRWKELILYGQQEYELKQHDAALLETEQCDQQNILLSALFLRLDTFFKDLGANLTKILFSYYLMYGSASSNQLMNVGSYWLSFAASLQHICEFGIRNPPASQYVEKILLLFQMKPTVKEVPESPSLKLNGGQIEFINVRFGYCPGQIVMDNINMALLPGKMTAIVGATGAGKSTLLDLIWRRYDVDSGLIQIDGQDIKTVALKSLRRVLGVVPQFPVILDGLTIKENIRYARKDASDDEVLEASRLANLHFEIENTQKFPQGYETEVGKEAIQLSGGEIQRIAIARLVLQKPKIILLDEATSSLDAENEFHVKSVLSDRFRGHTTLIIAHRLSTIVDADNIMFIDQGRVVESGSHRELISQQGMYAKFYHMQFGMTNETRHRRSRSV